jgi:ACS family hexuronate transporter-like MFS transporter
MSPSGSRTTFSRRQWVVAILLFFMILLNYLDRVVLALVSPILRKEFNLTQMDYAVAINAFLIAYGLMYLGSGLVLDRIGSRAGLAYFVGFWSLACMMHAAISGFYSLVSYRFLLGIFEPGGWTGAVKTVSERYAPVQRSLAAGIFTSGAGIGSLIAPPLVVWLSLHYGWRSAFLIAGFAGAVWLPLWLLATGDSRRMTEGERPPPMRQVLPRVLRDPRCLAYAATRFFGDTTGYFFLFWLPEYLVTAKGFTLGAVGALAWIPFLWNDIGALWGGYASGRLVQSRQKPVQARKLMMSLAAVFVLAGTLLQTASGVIGILLSVSLCTFGVGIWSSNLHSVAADGFAPTEVATVHGLAGSAGAVGGILFNTLVGHLSMSGDYFLAFCVLVTLQPLGVAALWIWMPDRKEVEVRSGAAFSDGTA